MTRNLAVLTQRWGTRVAFRPRGSAFERMQGRALYGFTLVGLLLLAVLPSSRPLIVFVALGVPLFVAQGTALLFTVPNWWERSANWLHDFAPKWVYILLIVGVGFAIVLSVLASERTEAGLLAISLALAARTAASLTEPRSYALEDRPYAGRIRRAALIHGGFMVFLSLGVAIMLGQALHSAAPAALIGMYLSVAVSTGAFFFKVHQRIRRNCIRTYDRIGAVLIGLAHLDGEEQAMDLEVAVRLLNRTLAAPMETIFGLWGRPITPAETRVKLIDWLNSRVAAGMPLRDSADPEYRALLAISAACIRWNGED